MAYTKTQLPDTLEILDTVQDIQYKAMSRSYSLEKLLAEILDKYMRLTGSKNGFIGRVYEKDNAPVLKLYSTVVEGEWKVENQSFYHEFENKSFEICEPKSVLGWIIKNKKALITDDLKSHPASTGFPSHHPEISSLVAVPLMYKDELIGMISISNNEINLTEEQLSKFYPFFTTCASIIKSLLDLDQKEEIEAKLRRFKYALDESSIVAVTDVKGTITYVNHTFSKVSKYSSEELIGQNHRLINSGYHDLGFFKDMWKTISNGDIWKGVIKNRAKDGSYYWVNSTIIPFMDKSGKPYEYLAIRNDVTQQKIVEEKLKQRNKELDQFAYIASHDLRAPLRGIATLVNFLEEDMPELNDACKTNFGLLKSRVKHLNNIIEGLLEYSRVGNVNEHTSLVDIHNLVTEIVASLNYPDYVNISIKNTLPIIITSDTLIYHVFLNLISNAVKHSDKENIIVEISCKEMDNWIMFQVCDNGTGIPEKLRGKVFNMFQTITNKGQNESTGIGLAIVKKVLITLGGRIEINDSELGGACFIFTLPKFVQ